MTKGGDVVEISFEQNQPQQNMRESEVTMLSNTDLNYNFKMRRIN